jgi:uncharacterized repeat protein (TIGR01451 family)
MNAVLLKHLITSTVLVGTLASHSAFAVLINNPAELTGKVGMSVNFGNGSVGVGSIVRWTEHICKKFAFITRCHDEARSANQIQSSSSRYKWDFGDGNSVSGVVSTSGGYFADGSDNLLVNLPSPSHTYLEPGIYNASLTVTDSNGQTGTKGTVVMVQPSLVAAPNFRVCDPNNATIESASSSYPWNSAKAWASQRVPTVEDIVLVKKEHTIRLPKGNSQIQVTGLCIEGTVQTQPNNTSSAPNHVVITAGAIHNRGTISTTPGNGGSIGDGVYKHATAGGSISIFAGRFINEGQIAAQGRGGDDVPYRYPDYFKTASGQIDAWGGDGGHIGIFPSVFTNTGSLRAGDGGNAALFKDWATFLYGNAYAGRGGSVHVSTLNMAASSSSGNLAAGCGGSAESIGSWLQQVKMTQGNWFMSGSFTGTYTGKLFDVVGGTGGNVSVNLSHLGGVTKGCQGQTINHVLVFPTQVIRYDPTLLEVDETTRLENANFIYIYAGDDAQVDLRKLSPNAVQAYKTVTLSVGQNSVIDLRGVSGKVFQAGEQVEVYADNILLDDGVTLENLVDAPKLTVNPSKVLHFVDVDYQSQAKGAPGSILPVNLTLLNNGPTEDTYTITAKDSQGWLLPPYPTEVSAGGLRHADLFINVKLPTSGNAQSELVVTVTSQADPTVTKEVLIRASVQYPELITPRDGRLADVAIVLDANYRMGEKLHDLANIFEKLLMAKGPVSPSDSKMEAWLSQFDDNHPPTKEAYLEFIQKFQPKNPPPLPVMELITFTNTAITRVVTDNLAEVIGRIRDLQTAEDDTCALASVDAVEYATTNLKPEGHLFLAVASTPSKDMSAAIQQLQTKRVKVHVLLAENCDGSAETTSAYQTLSEKTGGIFRVTTEDKASDMAALEDLLDTIMNTGKYTVFGTIKNESGEPLAGVAIEINTKTTTTDAAGNWEIPKFMEGEYTLTARKDGYVFAPQMVALGNEVYRQLVAMKPLSSLALVAVPHTWEAIRQGEDLTYTFSILNGGAKTATGVTLTDVLPTGAMVVALKSLDGGSCDLGTLICQLPNLNSGASATVELTLHNDGAETLRNVATLNSNEYPADIQTSTKKVKPHLSVTLTDTPDPIVMKSTLHYQAEVELSALAPEETANAVKLILRLPEGTELVDVNTKHGVCDISEYPTVVCELGDLSIATPDRISQVVVEVNVKLTDAMLLVLTHEAKIAATNYPAQTVREHTQVVVPPEAMADIMLVMDTTHSMNEEVNGVIKALQSFLKAQMNAKVAPVVSVIEFKDNVTLRAFTRNLQQVIDVVQQFEVGEGGLCQEASAEALDLAITHTVPGGTIVLVTDASPYEGSDVNALARRLKEKRIKFNTLISGDCTTSSGTTSLNNLNR